MIDNNINAKLKLLRNLTALTKTIAMDLKKCDNINSVIPAHALETIRRGADVDIDMYIDENDNAINIPEIKIDNYLNIALDVKTDGGKLVAYNCTPDNLTMQIALDYITDEGNQIQLAMAEVKKGELADTPDNKNIDVYSYNDIYSDDYTDKFTIEYDEIDDAF